MKSFIEHNPAALCIFYILTVVPLMFITDPVISSVGLVSGVLSLAVLDSGTRLADYAFYAAVPPVSAIINPLFNHNGVTALFFINNNPITLEAVKCGFVIGLVLSAVLLWCRVFTAVMDSDKLLYITGRLSPKLSLILSMALRYIPLYRRQAGKTLDANKAMGLVRESNAVDRIKSGMRVFSGMVTWALENGVVTADSMTARGYGSGKRTRYSIFNWEPADTLLVLLAVVLTAVTVAASLFGHIGYSWYPTVVKPEISALGIAGYAAYCAVCMAPVILEVKERLKWRSLLSKI